VFEKVDRSNGRLSESKTMERRRSRLSCPSSLASAEESEKYGLKTAAAKIVVNQQSGESKAPDEREGNKNLYRERYFSIRRIKSIARCARTIDGGWKGDKRIGV